MKDMSQMTEKNKVFDDICNLQIDMKVVIPKMVTRWTIAEEVQKTAPFITEPGI